MTLREAEDVALLALIFVLVCVAGSIAHAVTGW